jgi:protein SCO1/2
MKLYRRWRALLALMLCLLLGVCTTTLAVTDHTNHAGHAALPATTYSARSIYQVESTWMTMNAQPVRLEYLQGKVQVLAMVYTTCESACPIIVNLMQRLEAALLPEFHSEVGFVLVSLDPERDTPSVLKAYRDKRHLDPASWSLLSGHPDDVLELATLLGIAYKRDQRGGFTHSNVMTLLNRAGEIVHRQEGLQQDLTAILEAIRRAAQP